jgi:hypothetical protein
VISNIKYQNHNLVNAIVGKTILQKVVFFYAYSFFMWEPIPALRYTLFCPALFSMDRKELLAVALALQEKPTAVLQ